MFIGLGLPITMRGPAPVAAGPAADDLDTMLAALEGAGKLVSAWFLPLADPDQYLALTGANVTQWTAAYGSSKADMLAGGGTEPQWDAALFSNKGGLTFNGTSQCFVTSSISGWPDDASDVYLLAGVRQDRTGSVAGSHYAIGYGNGTNLSRLSGRTGVSNVNRTRTNAGANAVSGATADFSGAHTIGAHFDIGGTTTVYFDGAAEATVATATAALALQQARIGANAALTAASFWQGAIVAAAILNSTATLTDFTDLEALMRARLS